MKPRIAREAWPFLVAVMASACDIHDFLALIGADLCITGPRIEPNDLDLTIGGVRPVVARRNMPDPPRCPAFTPAYQWTVSDSSVVQVTQLNDSTVQVLGIRIGSVTLEAVRKEPPPGAIPSHFIVVRVGPAT